MPRTESPYSALRALLLSGALRPGERLVERRLCDQLRVSRTPLREALLVLSARGFVDRRPGCSWRVTRLTERDLHDIYSTRADLDSLALRTAIARASDLEVDNIGELVSQCELAYEGRVASEFTRANARFHSAVYEATHSRWLGMVSQPLRDQTRRIRSLISIEAAGNVYPETHRNMFQALQARDEAAVDRICHDHTDQDLRVALRYIATLSGEREAMTSRPPALWRR